MAFSEREVLGGLAEIINEEIGIALRSVSFDKRFAEDFGADNQTMDAIFAHIRNRFDIEVPVTDRQLFKTVGDAVAYIQAAQS
jgi:acyl carrier protein